MSRRWLILAGGLAAVVLAPLALVVFVALSVLGASPAMACTISPPSASPGATAAPRDWPTQGSWTSEQVGNAATIVAVGAEMHVPRYGWEVAVATAMQESTLRNLGHLGADNDHDSLGLFQQRPSQGWGTPEQILDPRYAARKFYEHLVKVDGWQTMPLTQAAQAVQRSAFPDAYAKWRPEAEQLVVVVASGIGLAIPVDLEQCLSTCPAITASDAGGCVEVATVFGRAQSWLTAWSGSPVPYLSSGDPADWFQGYRRDCSGYVSMALGLEGPGLNTSGLAAHSTMISKSDLRPGDLLINTAPDLRGHVVLFERWTDASMNRYYGYEQSGGGGTHHRVIPFPYFGDYPMVPYRLGRGAVGGE